MGVFLAEVIAMSAVQQFGPSLTVWQEILIDAVVMTILVIPVVYFLSFRPLLAHIDQRQAAEEQLRRMNDELEFRVRERTQELSSANEALRQRQSEIEGLLQGARAVLEHRAFADSARIIFDNCKRLTGATAGYVALDEGDENTPLFLDAGDANCLVDLDLPMPIRGLRALAYEERRTVYDNDFSRSEWLRFLPDGHADLKNVLFSPLIIDREVVGLIGLANKPCGFTENDARMATAFGEIAAVALLNSRAEHELMRAQDDLEARVAERTRQLALANDQLRTEIAVRELAEAKLERSNRELALLNEASLALSQMLELEALLDTLIEYMNRLVPSDSSIILLQEDEGQFRIFATRGYERPERASIQVGHSLDTGPFDIVRTLMITRQSVLISDTKEHLGWQHFAGAEHVRSWLGVPLIAGRKVIGLYALEKSTPHYFTADHVRLAETLISQAATTIQNAWLYKLVHAGRERLQILSRRLVEVQESERRYIAHELHDEAGQTLASLMMNLKRIEESANEPEMVQAELVKVEQTLLELQENLHRLAMSLRPASLDHLGLVAAVGQQVELIGEKYGLNVQFKTNISDDQISPDIQTGLYRIIQESLTNAARHARAENIDVLLNVRSGTLVVIVEDDGCGFEPELAIKKDRIGLIGMRERAEMLGGKLSVESAAGKGTTILVEIPYVNSSIDHR